MKSLLRIALSLVLSTFFMGVATAQVDYNEEIQPIFNANCTSCHGSSAQSGVNLTSYDATMSSVGTQYGQNIVVPGQPNNSPLVDKIEPSPQFGDRMPQGGALSEAQITLIRTWISEGADEVASSNEYLTELPNGFSLKENYPNPFNPSTNIVFNVPEAVSYQIQIYASNGALVEELAGNASAGTVDVRVALGGQPSGVYFYQVKVSTAVNKYLLGSEKMTLIK